MTEPKDILKWVDANADADTIIGIDAPIVIPNATGMRDADKLAHSFYGRYHAGAYPASQARRFWKRTTGLSSDLRKLGFEHGDTVVSRSRGRYQIEVHPHAAAVQLFALDRIIKYKKGSVAERASELGRLHGLMLDRLPRLTPPIELAGLPSIPKSGPELKDLEDRLDALTCAYVAAHWWYWGVERNDVLGDAENGYIVVPKRETWFASLADLRENYTRAGLLESDLDRNPIRQFEKWFSEARSVGMKEPHAMTLATVSSDGQPSARIVLLKGIDAGGFVFYTNYESRKAKELAENPRAALLFYWPELERQVRITGKIAKISRTESDAYFQSRPRGSQLGAWASQQSEAIPDREVLERKMGELESEYRDKPVPLPPFWGGYRLKPDAMEFWQGRPNRLHDRLRYTRRPGSGWKIERLSP